MPADRRKSTEAAHASKRTEGYGGGTCQQTDGGLRRRHMAFSSSGLKSTPGERPHWQIMRGFLQSLHTNSPIPNPYLLHILPFKAVNQRFTKVFGSLPFPFHKFIPGLPVLSYRTVGVQPIREGNSSEIRYHTYPLLDSW
jgi:hypothetical protein